jgi:hypothetical protein
MDAPRPAARAARAGVVRGGAARHRQVRVVLRAQEIQAGGRESGRREGAVAFRQQSGHGLRRLAAVADGDQRPHQVAHHVMQERVGLEVEAPVVADAGDVDAAHFLDRRQRLASRRAERAEVSLADQRPGRLAHLVDVERTEDPAAHAGFQGRTHGRLAHEERVPAPARAEARVEVGLHVLRPLHRDVLGQVAVGAAHPRGHVP